VITEEERQSIINEAIERALLLLPEVVGNLIMSQAKMIKLSREFHKKYPDLVTNKELAASVIEKIESENPGGDFSKVLEKAAPLIRERLRTVKSLDLNTVKRPNRDLSSLNVIPKSDHGDL
jgi:hypothetical protein